MAASPDEPAPLSALVQQVSVPHSKFTLDNGLTVLVNEDRKAPVVAFNIYYNVGSKDEPAGKTGFAHLFEHLMFYGSDNVREGIMPYLEKLGATDWNGTTWFDRTNYFQTVPKGALEKVLFMESDRMGYLLGAVDQKRLDMQRSVVQNEKRQGDNEPGGLVEYELLEALFPVGHPYRHSTIGSMADLDAASLADVKQWFIERYGPNNAVVALSGDITEAEARTLMQKYFGAIPRGAVNNPAQAAVPTLAAPKNIVMKDKVATVELQRHWATPGLLAPEFPALDVGAAVLGGLKSSRLDRILVREEKLAVSVSANAQPFHRVGMMEINVKVKPGVDPAVVDKRLDEIVADYLANGPTADEVKRAGTEFVGSKIRGLEKVGDRAGKAPTLAEGQLYAGDSDFYRKQLAAYAALTPDQVRSTMSQWLSRPVVKITLEPGERPPYVESKPVKSTAKADVATPSVKRADPPFTASPPLDFPTVEHATLANGLKVRYAQRAGTPLTSMVLSFDAGFSAETAGQRGLQNMVMSLLDEGAAGMTAQQIAEKAEILGAEISTSGTPDRSRVSLSALTPNLVPSLKLMSDIATRPDFAPVEVERVRTQIVTSIAQAKTSPSGIASRALPALMYGEGHPYGSTAAGDDAAVARFTRDDLLNFQQRWLRPDNAELFVVSDLPFAEMKPILEAQLGGWTAPAVAKGAKQFGAVAPRRSKPRIVLIDRPSSPQTFILGGAITPVDPRGENSAFTAGVDLLGGRAGARINQDLRETKGWSYGAFGYSSPNERAVPFMVQAPVQADRSADSVLALMKQVKDIVSTNPAKPEELSTSVASIVGELPGSFETGSSVLGAMQSNALFGRPDDYQERMASLYGGLQLVGVNSALRASIDPNSIVYVVVGDAAKVRAQLAKAGLKAEEMAVR
ncbi:insulinase family protein [Sphingomonas rhizophila]|uniref:Insulinase family protein n=1 Tax=Sphingomonas rhizophila TaxID=2071607 RepID=A0A7G9SAX1_9SPHN|nr:pitrilysin family protein [Sphingomonas rhizophila]QNN64996.1 insulinase family protein [Sphingomonas rhizophila]